MSCSNYDCRTSSFLALAVIAACTAFCTAYVNNLIMIALGLLRMTPPSLSVASTCPPKCLKPHLPLVLCQFYLALMKVLITSSRRLVCRTFQSGVCSTQNLRVSSEWLLKASSTTSSGSSSKL